VTEVKVLTVALGGVTDLTESVQEILTACRVDLSFVLRRCLFGETVASVKEFNGLVSSFGPRLILLIASSKFLPHARLLLKAVTRPVLVISDDCGAGEIMDFLGLGVTDFITAPVRAHNLVPRIWRIAAEGREEDHHLGNSLRERLGLECLVGQHVAFLSEIRKIPAVARCDVGVLVVGETGTGKELCARAIHYLSPRVGTWVEQQIATLGMTGDAIRDAIIRFLDSLSWDDIFDLGGVWDRAKRILTGPIGRIIGFVRGLVGGIVRLIKDALLRPLARLAEGTRGYDLLKVILGEDPITGEPVARNAETIIGGFMRLIGRGEIWENIKKSNAVGRAWVWFQGVLSGLLGFARSIPGRIIGTVASLTITDIVTVAGAFRKIAGAFANIAGEFSRWALDQVIGLLEILFSVVAPGAMPYLRRAAGAFRTILQNPVGFARNFVQAGRLGFQQFAGRFVVYLQGSIVQWLTGVFGSNVYMPRSFALRELIRFVVSVMGLTWQHVRQRLVRVVGETAVGVLERGSDIVAALVREGPAAAWEKIKESLSDLKEVVIDEAISFVATRIVRVAITRLVSMLSPAGAFIQAIIAIHNTIMLFVDRLQQIAQVGITFVGSISATAAGAIVAAANRVEQTLANLLTPVIRFLARIAGLGRVSDAVRNVINRIRARVVQALDRVVQWIVAMVRRIGGASAVAEFPKGRIPGTPELKRRPPAETRLQPKISFKVKSTPE
jgi:hypothetical protein